MTWSEGRTDWRPAVYLSCTSRPPVRPCGRDGPAPRFTCSPVRTAGVPLSEQLGVEAAAIGSGLADAWVNPDGEMLLAGDGGPLLDTQLLGGGMARTSPSLADVLVPAEDAAVPAEVVAGALQRIGYALTAPPVEDGGLTIGRDGSWRAGSLVGAHIVPEVTLIGAADREASRIAALEAVRAELSNARMEFEGLRSSIELIELRIERTALERAERAVRRRRAEGTRRRA